MHSFCHTFANLTGLGHAAVDAGPAAESAAQDGGQDAGGAHAALQVEGEGRQAAAAAARRRHRLLGQVEVFIKVRLYLFYF